MKTEIQKLADIIYNEVGFNKTPKDGESFSGGWNNVPKLYETWRDFALHIFELQKEGIKEYKGVSVDYIINYAKKFKPKICKTILEQMNIEGGTDKIIVIDKKVKIQYEKDLPSL